MYATPGYSSSAHDLQMIYHDAALFSPFALLPIAACLAYIAPACVAAQMGRLWHVLLFSALAILSTLHQACDAGSQLQLGGYMACSQDFRDSISYLNNVWSHFCFLQVCFVVLGPEDPWLSRGKLLGLSTPVGDMPFDVLLFARLMPLLTLLFGLRKSGDGSSEDWHYAGWKRGILINDVLLVSMCVAWWMGSITRRVQALEVLLRIRFWIRVGVRLVIPGILLIPIAFSSEVLEWRMLRAARHVACAAIAASILGAVFRGQVDIADRSPENWLIVPWLLLGQALTLIPTVALALTSSVAACGLDLGQCTPPWRWPTLSMAATLPDSHFILSFGTPAMMLTAATTIWIIDAAPIIRPPRSLNAAWWSAWGRQLPITLPSAPVKLREICRWLGCRFLASSIMFGVLAAALDEGSPVRNALHVAATIPFFGSLWLGIILCTASADNSTLFGLLRFAMTSAIAKGMVVLLVLFTLVNQYVHNTIAIPHSVYASTEYVLFLLLGLWPISWIEDARAIADPSISCPRETDLLREAVARTRAPHV